MEIEMSNFDNFALTITKNQKNIQRLIKSVIMDENFSPAHLLVLRSICSNEEGASANQICKSLSYDKALVSRVIASLEQKNFVVRNPKDLGLKRGFRLIATDLGNEYVEKSYMAVEKIEQYAVLGISKEEQEIFFKVLMIIGDNLEEAVRHLKETED